MADDIQLTKRKKSYFSKVEAAREALASRSYEIVKIQLRIIKEALKHGDYKSAAAANQFLLEHTQDAEGNRPIVGSIDKKAEESVGSLQPSIQIGFNIGGLLPAARLPEPGKPVVIDITPLDGAHEPEPTK
jgi:hypothetical protein